MAVTFLSNANVLSNGGTTVVLSAGAGAGDNRATLAGISGGGVSSVSVNAGVLTFVGSGAGQDIYQVLAAPAEGFSLTVSRTTYGRNRLICATFAGVEQASPTGALQLNSGTSATSQSPVLTLVAGAQSLMWHFNGYTGGGGSGPTGSPAGSVFLSGFRDGGSGQSVAHARRETSGRVEVSFPSSRAWQTASLVINPVAAAAAASLPPGRRPKITNLFRL